MLDKSKVILYNLDLWKGIPFLLALRKRRAMKSIRRYKKMEQLTSKYETVFIVKPELTEEAAKAVCDKFTGLITTNNGVIDNVSDWGKKKLAYPIEDLTEGYYYVVNFTSGAELPAELDRVFNISDDILRSIIVKLDK